MRRWLSNTDGGDLVMFFGMIVIAILFVYIMHNTSFSSELGSCVVISKEYKEAYDTEDTSVDEDGYATTDITHHPEQWIVTLKENKYSMSCEMDDETLFKKVQPKQLLNGCVWYRLWKNNVSDFHSFEFAEQ